jgi:two-component system phosphate regulon response regulator OmpR
MSEPLARVLVVDDEADLRSLLQRYLGDQGYAVRTLEDAKTLDTLLARERFDVLVLDVMMPGEDGLAVCRRLRAQGETIPIVMLTARGDPVDRIVGLEMGADDYLPKPFNPRELLARLRAVLRRRAGPSRATLRFGRLEIDPEARQVRLDGRERPLTSYQFDLLLALAESAGRVLSREALMQHARGDSLEAFDRSIDVHVSRLRAAIEDDPRRPRRILTVRGAGYVFARRQDQDG